MDANGKPTGTEREHLHTLLKRGSAFEKAEARNRLDGFPLPRAFRRLWRHFRALEMWRGSGGMGAAPLTLADIREYESRFGARFLAGELDLLKRLDLTILAER